MFELVIEKFDKYWDKMNSENPANFNQDLAAEVKKRLEQSDYLYKVIMEKHSRSMELLWEENRFDLDSLREKIREVGGSVTKPKSKEQIEREKLIFEMELLTESFYYLAGRVRTAITKSKPFPSLESFECEGVRNVRNKLLEHVEGKDSKVLFPSFGVGGEQGPTLKPYRPNGQENIFPDKGLEANATEFKNNLEKLLDQAI